MNKYREKAMELFSSGYNCAQAVVMTFAPELGLDIGTAEAMSAPFGGGMGRLRQVCGAVSGMFMIFGLAHGGYGTDTEIKKAQYAEVQKLARLFEEKNGSIICRELLGLDGASEPVPEKRTKEYYEERPCRELVGDAAEIIAEQLSRMGKL